MPIGMVVNKSFFKSQVIAANIPCVLNELNSFYRLTDDDVRCTSVVILF